MNFRICACIAVLSLAPAFLSRAATDGTRYQEIYGLIRSHVPGATDAALNQAALDGLLRSYGASIRLASNAPSTSSPGVLSQTNLFDGSIAYVRVGAWGQGLDAAITNACVQAAGTNVLRGLVLDLRYVAGTDYPVAVAVADLFVPGAQPLLDWGAGVVKSGTNSVFLKVPVAVLVNGQTQGAPEALAAELRDAGAAMIFGSRTAGRARIEQAYPLSSGGELLVATTPVKLGSGAPVPLDGIRPDVDVVQTAAEERDFYANIFVAPQHSNNPAGGPGTNSVAQARRPRLNEAQLVRERKEGADPDAEPAARPHLADREPIVTDPVLARALDVLKGLAVLRADRL
ncbi:MAG: S41 family peptidase [Verrucomicrobiota bacterium]